MLVVELKLRNDELVGTIKGTGKDGTGQAQNYTLSLKRAKTQWSSRRSATTVTVLEYSMQQSSKALMRSTIIYLIGIPAVGKYTTANEIGITSRLFE